MASLPIGTIRIFLPFPKTEIISSEKFISSIFKLTNSDSLNPEE